MAGDLIMPLTGEIVMLDEPEMVARALAEVDEIMRAFSDAKRILSRTLADLSVERGERTVTLPGASFVREGGPMRDYRPDEIERGLRDAGMPEDRIREIVMTTISKKVNAREAAKAARSNDRYREIIEAGTIDVERPYRIRVTLTGGEQS